jgi:predicted transcriptional regulator
MRKSKLESYEAILEALSEKPLEIDSLSYKLSGNCGIIKERLGFLIENKLVEKRLIGKKRLFAITERGEAVFRTLSLQKRLEKLKVTVRAISENPELVSTSPKTERNTR